MTNGPTPNPPPVVKVPGPVRLAVRSHEQTSAVHVLVLGELEPDGDFRDAHIEHPASCPSFCHWMPEGVDYWGEGEDEHRGGTSYGCLVAWELEGNSLDSLTDEHGRDWRTRRAWTSVGGTRYAEKPGLERLLPAGRYLVQAWYHDGTGTGEYGGRGDADSSFTLLGPETPLALTYPPNLLTPHNAFTGHHHRPHP